jgi:hypothetical protein
MKPNGVLQMSRPNKHWIVDNHRCCADRLEPYMDHFRRWTFTYLSVPQRFNAAMSAAMSTVVSATVNAAVSAAESEVTRQQIHQRPQRPHLPTS